METRPMKTYKLFVASSINEFSGDRMRLASFILSLNGIYNRRGVNFQLPLCEEMDDSMAPYAKQDEFDAEIRASRYFYLLIGRDAGEWTVWEYRVAREQFEADSTPERKGYPRIHTWFRKLPEGQTRTPEAEAFREELRTRYRHYDGEYDALDTLKLKILMEITRDEDLHGQVKLEDGKLSLDNQPLPEGAEVDMERVPAYGNHGKLRILRRRLAKLDRELAELTVRCHADRSDTEAAAERLYVSGERNRLADEVHAMEAAVLDTFALLASLDRDRLTDRAREAADLLDDGQYEAARTLLQSIDSPEIRQEWDRAETAAKTGTDLVRALITENRLRIQALRAAGVTKETLPELTACYEKSARAAMEYHIEPEAVLEYAEFLYKQNDYPEAIRLCHWIEAHYQQEDPGPYEWGRLYGTMGKCYRGNRNFPEGEDCYRKASNLFRALAEENPKAYAPDVALTCNNLANLLADLRRHEEAESLYREALDNYCALAEENPKTYAANVCNNLAVLLKNLHRYEEAEPLYREALEIRRALAEENPKTYAANVANVCNNLAVLLDDLRRYEDAEPLYREALDNYRTLAEGNPQAYSYYVATTCFNLGLFEFNCKHNPAASKAYFEEALSIFEQYPYLAELAERTHKILETSF